MTPHESIERLVADGIVDALIQRVKTGKEAEVFIVRKGESFFAAKVYKERNARSFRNNVDYREGRQVRNTRDQRAMAKGTKYGHSMAESDWMHTEHDALVTVAHAGLRVPKPELFYEGVLLMELVLGTDGQPAPRLIEVPLSAEEASAYHREIIGQIVGMLACDLIHGDLSPYNILVAWNGPTVIDLPQVVKAAHNSQAEKFLIRDVRNVTDYLARFAPELRKRLNDGVVIWRKYMRRELTPDYFPDEAESAAAARAQEPSREHHRPPPRRERAEPARPPAQHRPPPAAAKAPAAPAHHRPPHPAAKAPAPAERHPPGGHGQAATRRPHHPGSKPARPGGAPPPPPKRLAPPGPIIQRVTRLAPSTHAPAHGAGPRPDSPPSEGPKPGRFSMHHRRR